MKIAILTFHWATNYGAVLQAYALQQYLIMQGNDVEIINYFPSKYKKNYINALKTKHIKVIPKRLLDVRKEQLLDIFRKKHLNVTEYFNTCTKLNSISKKYDCYICGSDQIWNSSFLQYGEKNNTYVYFLDFADENKIIASYAGSFGTTEYPEKFHKDLKKYLGRFDFISVRENSGMNIINKLGIFDVALVPDPTILLDAQVYLPLASKKRHKDKYIYTYMLHNQKIAASKKLHSWLTEKNIDIKNNDNCSIEDWLSDILHAEMVVTNSFHGVVFSILFKKDFVALPINGSGMNDRLYTILDKLGLQNRIFDETNSDIDSTIDWDCVYTKLKSYQNEGYEYIKQILNHKK